MKQGEKLYQLADGESPYSSGNTLLIAALVAMGAQFSETQPYQEFREVIDGKAVRRVMWLLKEKTANNVAVKDLVNWWRDAKWQAANPEHPLCYVKAALETYKQLVDVIIKKAIPCNIVRRGKQMVILPNNATPERRAELLKKLEV
jgi:hypothetical protein